MNNHPTRPRRSLKHLPSALLLTALLVASLPLQAEPTRITTRPLAELLTRPTFSAPAENISLNRSVLGAELSARISSIAVEVGERVTQGAILLQLDCREAQANLSSASAAQSLAEKELQRARSLGKSNTISEQSLNQADTSLKQASAQRQLAQLQVERCSIRAPFNAVVTARMVSIGQLASPGLALLELVDIENVEISARLRAEQATALKAAENLEFFSMGERFKVKLRALTATIDSTSQTQEVRLQPVDAAPTVGSTGRLQWQSTQTALPAEFIQEREGMLGYFIAEAEQARFIALPEAQRGQPASLEVRPQEVILSGRQGLRDGDSIRRTGE